MIFLLFFIYVVTLNISIGADKLVYIIPPTGFKDQKIFDVDDPIYNRDGVLEPFVALKRAFEKLGYIFLAADYKDDLNRADFIICSEVPLNIEQEKALENVPTKKLCTILWEPPSVRPQSYDKVRHRFFRTIFTWHDGIIDGKKYKKIFFPQPSLHIPKELPHFAERKFCTLIAMNKNSSHSNELYSQRVKAISFFSQYPEFDFYGIGWDPVKYPRYLGRVANKHTVLKKYKFSICFENISEIPGCVTEKIWDCLLAGTVPVYWGASNISDYIPRNCFIDMRQFNNFESLNHFMRRITPEKYDEYIRNLRIFLASPQSLLFSVDFFIYLIIKEHLPLRLREIFDSKTLSLFNSLDLHLQKIQKKRIKL